MIRTLAITDSMEALYDLPLNKLRGEEIVWFWVDFNEPNDEENSLLDKFFRFHHLAIEDCIHSKNSPKLDYYEGYNYFILNALEGESLEPKEVSLFLGRDYIVSHHIEGTKEIDEAWDRVMKTRDHWNKGPSYVAHQIIDKIVDGFFPEVNKIEDRLSCIEVNEENKSIHRLIDEVFAIRKDLLKLRRIVNSMRDLLYRILNSERLNGFEGHNMYFSDIHDHLIKLSVMVEASREMTADIRDSYLSVNSAHMNRNMMVLTVITTIFIPLTFIVGVYGMNFHYMPELGFKYGYFIVLGVMLITGILMFIWFKIKGWFDI